MPQGAILTKDVKKMIGKLYYEDKTRPAKEVMAKVHEWLGRTDWPKLSVIQRELKKTRDEDNRLHPPGFVNIDSPWHLGLLPKYPQISAEGVKRIVRVMEWVNREELERGTGVFVLRTMPTRQALWIARLYDVVEEHWHTTEPATLHEVSVAYAMDEFLCETLKLPFEPYVLDAALIEGEEQFSKMVTAAGLYSTTGSSDNANNIRLDMITTAWSPTMDSSGKIKIIPSIGR